MTRAIAPAMAAIWAGTTLVLSRVRWFSRTGLTRRILGPNTPAPASLHELVAPLANAAGARLARMLGVREELARRLERVHAPLDVTAFRTRQGGACLAAFGGGAFVAVAVSPPPIVAVLLIAGAPLLAFLITEQQLAQTSERWQAQLRQELPVVIEQLAMLLSSGYSVGAALNRLATRGQGACARDLRRVCSRVRQGLAEAESLREWASIARVREVERLVAVLALERDATDLGRLLGEEARAARRDSQRRLVETIERRAQQVWVPVTVATLLPGVIFMAVPFVEALRVFSGDR